MTEIPFVHAREGVDGYWRGWAGVSPRDLRMITAEELEVSPDHIQHIQTCVGVGKTKSECVSSAKKALREYMEKIHGNT